MDAGFLPALAKDQADNNGPSELCLYRHAQDHRLLSRDTIARIVGHPSSFGDILGKPPRRRGPPDIKNYPVFRWTDIIS